MEHTSFSRSEADTDHGLLLSMFMVVSFGHWARDMCIARGLRVPVSSSDSTSKNIFAKVPSAQIDHMLPDKCILHG